MHLPINCRKSGQVLTSVTLVASNMSGRGKGGSLRSRRTKRRGWGEEGKRATSGKKMGGGEGGGKGTPTTKTAIGSFLRSLAAAKF